MLAGEGVPAVVAALTVVVADEAVPGALWLPHAVSISPQAAKRGDGGCAVTERGAGQPMAGRRPRLRIRHYLVPHSVSLPLPGSLPGLYDDAPRSSVGTRPAGSGR